MRYEVNNQNGVGSLSGSISSDLSKSSGRAQRLKMHKNFSSKGELCPLTLKKLECIGIIYS